VQRLRRALSPLLADLVQAPEIDELNRHEQFVNAVGQASAGAAAPGANARRGRRCGRARSKDAVAALPSCGATVGWRPHQLAGLGSLGAEWQATRWVQELRRRLLYASPVTARRLANSAQVDQ
jgi:hypothetical protein